MESIQRVISGNQGIDQIKINHGDSDFQLERKNVKIIIYYS